MTPISANAELARRARLGVPSVQPNMRANLARPAPLPDWLPAWKRIGIEVAQKHRLRLADLRGPRRLKHISRARHEAFWRCKEELGLSWSAIARHFGGRNHSSAIYGHRKHEQRMLEAAIC